MAKQEWPSWRYPPGGGEGRIFQKDDVIPKNWVRNPKEAAKAKQPKPAKNPKNSDTQPVTDEERKDAIEQLRANGVEIADDASDEEINDAIDKLTSGGE